MKKFNCILEKIIIEILIEMEQQMKRNFLRIHNFFDSYINSTHISVLMICFNNSCIFKSRNIKIIVATAFPSIFSNLLLSFIINIVNWSFKSNSSLMFEGVEN